MLNRYPTLTSIRLAQLFQIFIREEQYIPKDPPPYLWTIFCSLGRDIIDMISHILGCTTSEFVDKIIISIMSIYSLGQPPAIVFNYAKIIGDRMHHQFMRFEIERVFKYSSVLYHLFLYYQANRFPISLQKLDTRWNPISVIFWTSLIHQFDSQYSYTDFVDPFVSCENHAAKKPST